MGQIWLARLAAKHGFVKLVALKTILPEFAADPRFRRMFLDEASIASRISHGNVAQILDLGEHGDVLYHVMEWIDGDSLRVLARAVEKKKARMPLEIAARIVADACAGVHAAHELRNANGESLEVVHRDVSPHNILVSTAGAVKLTDFGIAKARGRLSSDTTVGNIKGKIHYMAPEQAVGGSVDRRADVWALGAVLYELLTGRPPYDGPHELAVLQQLLTIPPPLIFDPRIPNGLAHAVRRALSRDPAARFATAAEFQEELEELQRGASRVANAADVAAFADAYLFDRTRTRKLIVERALEAAELRKASAEAPASPATPVAESTPLSLDPATDRPEPPVADPAQPAQDDLAEPSATCSSPSLRSASIEAPHPRARLNPRQAWIVGASVFAAAVSVAIAGSIESPESLRVAHPSVSGFVTAANAVAAARSAPPTVTPSSLPMVDTGVAGIAIPKPFGAAAAPLTPKARVERLTAPTPPADAVPRFTTSAPSSADRANARPPSRPVPNRHRPPPRSADTESDDGF